MMELGDQFGSAIIISYLLEYLKNSPFFPFLSHLSNPKVKTILGGVAAFITTVGIHYAFDYKPGATSTITITIPSMMTLSHAIMDFAKQWAMQQFTYDTAVKDYSANNVSLVAVQRALSKTDIHGNIMEDGH